MMQSCGHRVVYITAEIAGKSLARWTEPGRSSYEVIECEKCHWFLIVAKKASTDGPDDPPGRADR